MLVQLTLDHASLKKHTSMPISRTARSASGIVKALCSVLAAAALSGCAKHIDDQAEANFLVSALDLADSLKDFLRGGAGCHCPNR